MGCAQFYSHELAAEELQYISDAWHTWLQIGGQAVEHSYLAGLAFLPLTDENTLIYFHRRKEHSLPAFHWPDMIMETDLAVVIRAPQNAELESDYFSLITSPLLGLETTYQSQQIDGQIKSCLL